MIKTLLKLILFSLLGIIVIASILLYFEDASTDGFPIQHNKLYSTTPISMEGYRLHTWMNDTIYKNCGYEITIEPTDSTTIYKLHVKGGILIRSQNTYRYTLQSLEDNLTLTILNDDGKKDIFNFICPELPEPSLNEIDRSNDSVTFELKPAIKRLSDILPKDSKYMFIGTQTSIAKFHIDNLNESTFDVVRRNFRGQTFVITVVK
ncbi:MAG: hypothetical protein OCD76_03555 [Reichenbachiella sp.]